MLSTVRAACAAPVTTAYDLERFVAAQSPVYDDVLRELDAGEKRTHWMWFIFPQVSGLGHSSMAREFAIASRDEANAFLRHPLLGHRLVECTERVNAIEGKTIEQIFGSVDAMKFRSSMTLFSAITDEGSPFRSALRKYYADRPDERTLERLTGR